MPDYERERIDKVFT
ncbi:hypothetical protein COM56_10180 [Bacillus cereus]|nr:hypothetical protein COM56_10180 [Bacillus cereus]